MKLLMTLLLSALAASSMSTPVRHHEGGTDHVVTPTGYRSPGKGGAAVELDYTVTGKPAPGRALTVTMSFASGPDTEWLDLVVNAGPGLAMSQPVARRLTVTPGQPVSLDVTVTPQAMGRFYLTAVVTASVADTRRARAFSVPIQVGERSRATKTRVPVSFDAKGERVIRLPALGTVSPRNSGPIRHTP